MTVMSKSSPNGASCLFIEPVINRTVKPGIPVCVNRPGESFMRLFQDMHGFHTVSGIKHLMHSNSSSFRFL